jgi:hypothetical protein
MPLDSREDDCHFHFRVHQTVAQTEGCGGAVGLGVRARFTRNSFRYIWRTPAASATRLVR